MGRSTARINQKREGWGKKREGKRSLQDREKGLLGFFWGNINGRSEDKIPFAPEEPRQRGSGWGGKKGKWECG